MTSGNGVRLHVLPSPPASSSVSPSLSKVLVDEGYYNFHALVDVLRREFSKVGMSLEIEMLAVTGKCRVKVGYMVGKTILPVHLDTIGPLLGFYSYSTVPSDSQWHVSSRRVNMSRYLGSVEVSCDIVETKSNVGFDGKHSDTIVTILAPIKGLSPNELSLNGTAQHYANIESKVPIRKGVHSSAAFRVKPNNGSARVCRVLLELYIV